MKKRMKPFMGNETFLLTYGDGVSNVDLEALLAFHKKHGKLPWRQLFESAIVLAREGFIVSNRLANLIAKDRFLTKIFQHGTAYC